MRAQRAPRPAPLPCQDTNNSTEPVDSRRWAQVLFDSQKTLSLNEFFPAASKRTAFALQMNVTDMCERFGLQNVGFLTLTFADHVLDPREAQRRMNSLTTHVLRPRYGTCIRVIERQSSGRIHYHILVNVGDDIRTGVDFTAFAEKPRGDYRSAPPALRREWSFWRSTAKNFGFGRTELMPVRSCSEAIGTYVGKYIAKHLNARQMRDKGVRLVSYSGSKTASTRFTWLSTGSALYRQKLQAFVEMLYHGGVIESPDETGISTRFGPRWHWYWRDCILEFPLDAKPGDLVVSRGYELPVASIEQSTQEVP